MQKFTPLTVSFYNDMIMLFIHKRCRLGHLPQHRRPVDWQEQHRLQMSTTNNLGQ